MEIAPVDLRALPAPEPLLRILEVTGDGRGPYVFLLPFEPRPLYPLLESQGWQVNSRRVEEGVEVTVSKRV